MQIDYAGRSVLVTGGTSCIGLEVARAFRRAGAGVLAPRLAACADHRGLRVETLKASDAAAVECVVAKLERLDVVVNAGGHDPARRRARSRGVRAGRRCGCLVSRGCFGSPR